MTAAYAARLAETLPRMRDRIAPALDAAGRDGASVGPIAVAKAHPPEAFPETFGPGPAHRPWKASRRTLGGRGLRELNARAGARWAGERRIDLRWAVGFGLWAVGLGL